MEDYKVCEECGGKMLPATIDQEFHFNGKTIVLKGLNAYKCEDCDEVVFEKEEVKMIERLVQAFDTKPAVEVLNLEETAGFLRVSNQTVYNMIREGRIRAYKAGREWRFLKQDILAYMDNSSNETSLKIAAKGGQITEHDLEIIRDEIERHKNND